MYTTDTYEALTAETVTIYGQGDDPIGAYFARPLSAAPVPGVVLIHHMPGWDEWHKEATLRFARHGYAAIAPNLYHRSGHGTPEEIAARVRAEGGVADDQVLGDVVGAMRYLRALPYLNGRVGVIGTCSGGRQAFLVACRAEGFDAVADCWGGRVIMSPEETSEKHPVAPIDYTGDLTCPLLGLFGEEDTNPSPAQVAQHETQLKKHGKCYEFHMYPGAGHSFFDYNRPTYRHEAATDGWKKVFAFFEKHLSPTA